MKEQNEKKTKKKKDSFLTTAFSFLILFPILFLMRPTVVFFFLAMLPTFLSLIWDVNSRVKFKYKWLCIGGVNFAGTLPFLFKLWFGDNSVEGAIGLFFGGVSFALIYLAALVGWIFYRCIPPLVLNVLEISDQRRVLTLREMQEKLIAKWGEEVTDVIDTKSAAAKRNSPVASVEPAKTPTN